MLIRQRTTRDCGVACLAMAACVDYETAKEAFDRCGLGIDRGKRAAYSSNFKELTTAFRSMGLEVRQRRFTDWAGVLGPAVMKVRTGKATSRDWHWVFANRTDEFGLHVMDPGIEFPCIENMPMNVMCVDISFHKPYGSFLEVRAP